MLSWDWASYCLVDIGFKSYLVLGGTPVVLVALVLIAFNQLGGGLGLAKLFRHEDGPLPARVFIGMGAGSVVWQALFAGYVFEEFATGYAADHVPWRDRRLRTTFAHENPGQMGEILSYMAVLAGVLALLAAAIWLVRCAAAWASRTFFNPPSGPPEPVPGAPAAGGSSEAGGGGATRRQRAARVEPSETMARVNSRWALSSWPFGLGAALGFCFMIGWSCVWLHVEPAHDVAFGLGARAIDGAGYGQADARRDNNELRLRLQRPLKQGEARRPDEYRGNLIPYYPVFGLWFLNIGLVLLVAAYQLVFWGLGRYGMYSPAIGIVLLMQFVIAIDVTLPVFVFFPLLLKAAAVGALLFLGGQQIYKYRIANLGDYYAKPVPLELAGRCDPALLAPPAAGVAVPPANALRVWRPAGGEGLRHPLVVVAASGGGSRAAAWTTAVMGLLEATFKKESIDLPYHVRLAVGASGGMIGMGNYVTSLRAPGSETVHDPGWPDHPAMTGDWQKLSAAQRVEAVRGWLNGTGTTDDWLTPVSHRLLYRDLPHLFLPRMPFADRGTVMEREWVRSFRGRLSTAFGQLRGQEQAGWRPSLVYTPLMVEDGRQLVVSNLNMKAALESLGPELTTGDRLLSVSGLQLFDLFPGAGNSFTVGGAARLSASFPYVLPASVLPTNPPRRLVDAGYFDNYGVVIATAWLHAHSEWVRANYSGVLLVQIRDGLSADARTFRRVFPDMPDSVVARGLHGFTSPLSGGLAARSASMTYRCDKLLDLVEHDFGGPEAGFFKLASFEFDHDEDVALSFRLTQEEVTAIAKASLDLSQDSLDAILEWWQARSGPSAPPASTSSNLGPEGPGG